MNWLVRTRAWARTHTRAGRYSPIEQTFHWSMAALVFFQLWWGWRIGRLPVGPDKLDGYQVHSQIGVLLLLLVGFRLFWRSVAPELVNAADRPGWQSTAARLTHGATYVCLLGLPLSGWAMWSAEAPDQALSVAGVAPWPHLPLEQLSPPTRWGILRWSEVVHAALVVGLMIIIPLHVGAALKHHFWDRDQVLAAMVPGLRGLEAAPQEPAPAAAPHKPKWLPAPRASNVD